MPVKRLTSKEKQILEGIKTHWRNNQTIVNDLKRFLATNPVFENFKRNSFSNPVLSQLPDTIRNLAIIAEANRRGILNSWIAGDTAKNRFLRKLTQEWNKLKNIYIGRVEALEVYQPSVRKGKFLQSMIKEFAELPKLREKLEKEYKIEKRVLKPLKQLEGANSVLQASTLHELQQVMRSTPRLGERARELLKAKAKLLELESKENAVRSRGFFKKAMFVVGKAVKRTLIGAARVAAVTGAIVASAAAGIATAYFVPVVVPAIAVGIHSTILGAGTGTLLYSLTHRFLKPYKNLISGKTLPTKADLKDLTSRYEKEYYKLLIIKNELEGEINRRYELEKTAKAAKVTDKQAKILAKKWDSFMASELPNRIFQITEPSKSNSIPRLLDDITNIRNFNQHMQYIVFRRTPWQNKVQQIKNLINVIATEVIPKANERNFAALYGSLIFLMQAQSAIKSAKEVAEELTQMSPNSIAAKQKYKKIKESIVLAHDYLHMSLNWIRKDLFAEMMS